MVSIMLHVMPPVVLLLISTHSFLLIMQFYRVGLGGFEKLGENTCARSWWSKRKDQRLILGEYSTLLVVA